MNTKALSKIGLLLLILTNLIYFFSTAALATDLKIIAIEQDTIELELLLPPITTESVQGNEGDEYSRLHIAHWATTHEIGSPELPLIATMLQVPPSGEVKIEVLTQAYHTKKVSAVYPVPRPTLADSGEIVETFTKNTAVYATDSFYPQQIIVLDERALLRDLPTMRVKVYPIQWNPQTQELRYWTQLRFRLRFSQPLPAQPDFDTIFTAHQQNLRNRNPVVTNLREKTTSNDHWPQRYRLSLHLKESGVYRLSYDDLQTAGVPESCLSQGQFVFQNRGQAIIPQVISKNSRFFSAGDRVEFYATVFEDTYTDTNVHYLDCWQLSRPRSISAQNEDKPLFKWGLFLDGTVTNAVQPLDSFQETLHFEENLELWEETIGAPQQDYWFWKQILAPNAQEIPLLIPNPLATATPAHLRVNLRGRTTATPHPNHHTLVYLNETVIGDYYWDGDKEEMQTLPVPPQLMLHGENQLRIESPGDTGARVDTIYTNWVELDYQRQLVAVSDSLTFSMQGQGRLPIKVTGFTTADIHVYDVTNANRLQEIVNITIQPAGEYYQVIFEDEITAGKTFYAGTAESLRQPERLILLPTSTLRQPYQGADYIVITAQEFLPAVQPLLEHRRQQGLRTMAVSIEEIYQEFNHGLVHPQAIKNFLKYAYENWQTPAPQYVLFIGDATIDYRNFHYPKKKSVIPAYLIATEFGLAPTDNWYVAFQGNDTLPEMLIGRLPGANPDQVTAMLDKIIKYETTPATVANILLASDTDPIFERANDAILPFIPATNPVTKVYLANFATDNDATAEIVAKMNEGVMLTQYMGHGTASFWGNKQKQRLFEISDLAQLQEQDHFIFLVVLNCLNANFSVPVGYSLAELFVLSPNKGAFGAFAPTNLGYLGEHRMIDEALFKLIFEKNVRSLGELVTQSKISAHRSGASDEVLETFVLIGDPASQLKVP